MPPLDPSLPADSPAAHCQFHRLSGQTRDNVPPLLCCQAGNRSKKMVLVHSWGFPRAHTQISWHCRSELQEEGQCCRQSFSKRSVISGCDGWARAGTRLAGSRAELASGLQGETSHALNDVPAEFQLGWRPLRGSRIYPLLKRNLHWVDSQWSVTV